jgi:hypothetical protein
MLRRSSTHGADQQCNCGVRSRSGDRAAPAVEAGSPAGDVCSSFPLPLSCGRRPDRRGRRSRPLTGMAHDAAGFRWRLSGVAARRCAGGVIGAVRVRVRHALRTPHEPRLRSSWSRPASARMVGSAVTLGSVVAVLFPTSERTRSSARAGTTPPAALRKAGRNHKEPPHPTRTKAKPVAVPTRTTTTVPQTTQPLDHAGHDAANTRQTAETRWIAGPPRTAIHRAIRESPRRSTPGKPSAAPHPRDTTTAGATGRQDRRPVRRGRVRAIATPRHAHIPSRRASCDRNRHGGRARRGHAQARRPHPRHLPSHRAYCDPRLPQPRFHACHDSGRGDFTTTPRTPGELLKPGGSPVPADSDPPGNPTSPRDLIHTTVDATAVAGSPLLAVGATAAPATSATPQPPVITPEAHRAR